MDNKFPYSERLHQLCATLELVRWEQDVRMYILKEFEENNATHSLVKFALVKGSDAHHPKVFTLMVGAKESFKATLVTENVNFLSIIPNVCGLRMSIFHSGQLGVGTTRVTSMPENDQYEGYFHYWLEYPIYDKTTAESTAIISIPLTDEILSPIYQENRILNFLKWVDAKLSEKNLALIFEDRLFLAVLLVTALPFQKIDLIDARPFSIGKSAGLTLSRYPAFGFHLEFFEVAEKPLTEHLKDKFNALIESLESGAADEKGIVTFVQILAENLGNAGYQMDPEHLIRLAIYMAMSTKSRRRELYLQRMFEIGGDTSFMVSFYRNSGPIFSVFSEPSGNGCGLLADEMMKHFRQHHPFDLAEIRF